MLSDEIHPQCHQPHDVNIWLAVVKRMSCTLSQLSSQEERSFSANCHMAQPKRRHGKKSKFDCEWAEKRYLEMEDEEFEMWALCRKCHEPLHIPKTLPCLHTICLRCLQIHFRNVRKQVDFLKKNNPNKYDFLNFSGCFTCPWCAFPCYTIGADLSNFPNNKRLLALTYRERLVRMREIEKVKSCEVTVKMSPKGVSGREKSDRPERMLREDAADHGRPSSNSPTVQQGGDMNSLVKSLFDISSPSKYKLLSTEDALSKHFEYVRRECRGTPDDLLGELESVCSNNDQLSHSLREYGHASPCGSYKLVWGDADLEIHAPSAIAVNPATGHVVVVDSMLNKALLFKKNLQKPWAFKQFHRPITDVCFYPPRYMEAAKENGYDEMGKSHPITIPVGIEMFCAMGRNLKCQGVIIYRVPFTKEPWEYSDLLQNGVRDVSGIVLLSEGRLCISLGYTNMLLLQIVNRQYAEASADWAPKFMDLASRSSHGLLNPTHLVQTKLGQMVVSDTNNHRIGVFYGPDYLASDFYCEFGHGKEQLFYPLGLAMDSQRHLYICDAGNHRIQVLNHCFEWHGFPIRATYRMGKSVTQDVKPIDCAVDAHDRLYVLFKGRQFVSLQVYNYQGPLISTGEETDLSNQLSEDESCCCCCSPWFCGCCRREKESRRLLYEVID
ncbi:RING finger protein nhl-1 [Plakobranchus ocellatus]|uniref:RING finger protein nhl-1 n=1 Tax=Plakobranchus ocellatus TaxID=259542 RepID=A0AAV3Z268_9GAST|nr:RING finger protein nhl-1 [Plakobranchus ocellatus]